jgi:drug/metabolite transporter (DMT)-like permease
MVTIPNTQRLHGSLAIFMGACVWGIFWLPLRHFDESGVHALWAVAAINLAACLIAVPAAMFFGKIERDQIKWLIVMGIGMGAANIFYFAGIIISDVIRVIFLFYLLPIWATLFSRILFKVEIGSKRLIAIGFAILGIWLLLGAGGWPVPENIGDVFGLMSGMFWAMGLTMMRGKSELDAFAVSASALFFAFLLGVLLALLMQTVTPEVQRPAPDLNTLLTVLAPIVAFGVIVLWPTLLAQIWGAKFVAATTAALLTMSEIVVATVSTSILGASDLSLISWIGAALILVAVFIDLFAKPVTNSGSTVISGVQG